VATADLRGESSLLSDAATPCRVRVVTLPALAASCSSQRLANLGATVAPTVLTQNGAGALT